MTSREMCFEAERRLFVRQPSRLVLSPPDSITGKANICLDAERVTLSIFFGLQTSFVDNEPE